MLVAAASCSAVPDDTGSIDYAFGDDDNLFVDEVLKGDGVNAGCVDTVTRANYGYAPADIIFLIDNSGSMSDEIDSVEANINQNFAEIIGDSAVDYRVIMLTNHGSDSLNVCIGEPLSSSTDCTKSPGESSGKFYHYDVDIQSHDGVCVLLDTLYGSSGGGEPDQWGLHPEGWSKWLRPEAFKTFVSITDDGIDCSFRGAKIDDNDSVADGKQAATVFDRQLLGLSPQQFGTTADRRYAWYSIVGLASNAAPAEPYGPMQDVTVGKCASGMAPGTGYQWLSRGTGALRFPVCQHQSYDALFRDIASGVIAGAAIPCSMDVPEPDANDSVNLDSLSVLFDPDGVGTSQEEFRRVAGPTSCGGSASAFWIDESANKIELCPSACSKVEAAQQGELSIKAICGVLK